MGVISSITLWEQEANQTQPSRNPGLQRGVGRGRLVFFVSRHSYMGRLTMIGSAEESTVHHLAAKKGLFIGCHTEGASVSNTAATERGQKQGAHVHLEYHGRRGGHWLTLLMCAAEAT